jgi:arginyl-tRNA synthetase
MRDKIVEILQSACSELFVDQEIIIELERPEEQFGDFACNVAMQLAKPLDMSPRDIAQKIVLKVQNTNEIAEIGVAGPGFINITVKDELLLSSVNNDMNKVLSGMKVLVEYSDPNPFKPLHGGHLYTTLVGDSISRIVQSAGAQTIRLNYGGDVGLHVAKSMWAIIKYFGGENYEKINEIKPEERSSWLGDRYVEGNNAYSDNEIAKSEIVSINKRVYEIHNKADHESEFAKIYWKCREYSYEFFKKLYKDLDIVEFDRFIAESEVTSLGIKTVNEQLANGVFEQSDGAVIFDGEKYGLHKRVFINSEGLPTYEAKDIGLSLTKWADYHFDESIIITASEQDQYMQVVIKAIEQFAVEPAERTRHITHGVVKLQDGQKMSSRLGNIVTADDILEAARNAGKTNESLDKESTILAAIKYAFLKNRIGSDIAYDPVDSVSMEGNSGPYLQYAHARAKSIIRNSDKKNVEKISVNRLEKYERSLVRKMTEYTVIVQTSAIELSPSLICNYLYELAQNFNRFYENSKVIGHSRENLRMYLVVQYSDILKNGLDLLGIKAPDEM